MRRSQAALVSVLVCVVAVSVVSTAPQTWRAAGLAAFDAAWLTIHDTYYDPAFGGLDWDGVRRELRPRVERASSPDEQRAIVREMLGRFGQSHFALLTASPDVDEPIGPAGVPFDVRIAAAGAVVTRLHGEAVGGTNLGVGRIRPGDVIRRIDDVAVDTLVESIDEHDPRRAELAWQLVTRALAGSPGTSVRLLVARPGGGVPSAAGNGQEAAAEDVELDIDVERHVGPGEVVTVGHLPPMRVHLEAEALRTKTGRAVGLIRFNVWMATVAEPFAEAVDRFRDHAGIVIDLRGNRGGLADMIRGVAGHFLEQPVVLGRMRMRDLDLEFRANPRRSTSDGRSVVPFRGSVALIVDELTASASECFAAALQGIGRAHVFGTRTSGQALPAVTQQLANGDVLLYVVGDFVTPTGARLEGAGVVPDVEVPVEPGSLAAGHDALHAALDWIDRQ